MAVQTPAPRRTTASRRTATTTGAGRSSTRSAGAPAARSTARRTVSTTARQSKQVAAVTAGEGQSVAGEAKARGQEVARLARSQSEAVVRNAGADARELTGSIKAQAAEVRDELATQTRALTDEARTRVSEQAHVQVRRAADGLVKLARSTETLAGCATGEAAAFRDYLSQGAEKIYGAADRVHGVADEVQAGDFEAIIDDVRAFARRRPVAFLLGAAVAGFGVGRLVRASGADDGTTDAQVSLPAGPPRAAGTPGRPSVAANGSTGRAIR